MHFWLNIRERFLSRFAGQFTRKYVLAMLGGIVVIMLLMHIISYVYLANYCYSYLSTQVDRLNVYQQEVEDNDVPQLIKNNIVFVKHILPELTVSHFMLLDNQGIIQHSTRPEKFIPKQTLQLPDSQAYILQRAIAGEASYASSRDVYKHLFSGVIAAIPIYENDTVMFVFVIHLQMSRTKFLSDFALNMLYALLLFVITTIPILIYTSRMQALKFSERLESLTALTQRWAQGDFTARPENYAADELGDLSKDLTQMAMQIDQLLQNKEELAVLQERNRLAIELHDSVKQHIFAVSLKVATLEGSAGSKWQQKHGQNVVQILGLLQNVKVELSRLIWELRPIQLENADFRQALEHFIKSWSQSYGVSVKYDLAEVDMEARLEQALFRIAQEAFANILKHSQAKNIFVNLTTTELTIQDDGVGFSSEVVKKGMGLNTMQQRIEELGGEFHISSSPQNGTQVRISYGKIR